MTTRALFKLIGGGLVFALFAYWVAHPDRYPFGMHPTGVGGALVIGAPGCLAMVGLIELITNRPIKEIEAAWAALGGLKKFLYGSLFVLVGGALAFALVALLVT